jgi:hypothetical protein
MSIAPAKAYVIRELSLWPCRARVTCPYVPVVRVFRRIRVSMLVLEVPEHLRAFKRGALQASTSPVRHDQGLDGAHPFPDVEAEECQRRNGAQCSGL